MGGACSPHREKRNAYKILAGMPERSRPLGRPRRRWEDTVKIDLTEIGSGGMGWIDLDQDRDQLIALLNPVILRVPEDTGKFLSS
jgi:hypothetical protein